MELYLDQKIELLYERTHDIAGHSVAEAIIHHKKRAGASNSPARL